MKFICLFLATALLTFGSITVANATVLTAESDAYVQSGSADTNFGASSVLQIKRDDNSSWTRKSYFGFDLSGLDSTAIASATFSLDFVDSVGISNSTVSYEFELFGLIDQALDNWEESFITWNNAPANQPDNDLNSSMVTSLGTFSLTGKGVGIYNFSTLALVDFLNADSNDFATLILRRNTDLLDNYTYVHAVASRENINASAPSLTITPVPEPSTVLLLGSGLIGLVWYGRKRK